MASVLITGTSKGIGRATAVEFARRGHRVVATARDPQSLAGLDVDQRLPLDVTDPASVDRRGPGRRRDRRPRLERRGDLLCRGRGHAARQVRAVARPEHGGSPPGSPGRAPGHACPRTWPSALHVQRRRAHRLPPGAAYAATKWALEALVESLAIEVAPFGLEAALLEPGRVSSGVLTTSPPTRSRTTPTGRSAGLAELALKDDDAAGARRRRRGCRRVAAAPAADTPWFSRPRDPRGATYGA